MKRYIDIFMIFGVVLGCIFLTGCGRMRQEETEVSKEKTDAEELVLPGDQAEDQTGEEARQGDAQVSDGEILKFVDAWGEWHETEIDPAIRKHDYNWSCLTNTEAGIQYAGDERYTIRKGIDVSEHQGDIDWGRVKAAGYDFAFLRIGYRGYGEQGTLCADAKFQQNIVNAHNAGVEVGVYLFSQAVSVDEALQEAGLVLEQLQGHSLELPVVFDPERIRDDAARTDNVTGEQFTKNTVLFCEKMKEAGYQPMIYSNMLWEAFEYDMEALADYPIWYADYEPVPQTPYYFSFWQYSEKGRVDGITGNVDLNVQFLPQEIAD
ncbi:glycoside hydrolase family 25 protein [Sporofaciens sp. JLR.KK001]|uniref:glycoside hydrolase family 25 protein n=1 Tax=Sporofaciens sp. JLR.KK001 TaxID=3112621 RepID=UPI002FF216B3